EIAAPSPENASCPSLTIGSATPSAESATYSTPAGSTTVALLSSWSVSFGFTTRAVTVASLPTKTEAGSTVNVVERASTSTGEKVVWSTTGTDPPAGTVTVHLRPSPLSMMLSALRSSFGNGNFDSTAFHTSENPEYKKLLPGVCGINCS